ncbi:TonB-dependent receptor [Paraglaciecola aquimarina]|uniref:TonB-dependent receptor n=1 Tax=Paraglaciecola aquimarina TaxID=1235557 RepID=A0ABU3SRH5_9ALTE|nr:TonB-dependent receptor [Paraglaciecola aquimarina]MDU0352607.1 TonB-dependent receptor [Paraglaciecola aquimarina]
MHNTLLKKHSLAAAIGLAFSGLTGSSIAQESETTEVIEVSGIRTALASALAEKRTAASIKEIIQAEDIGKLPDNNLAEVLENVTGVQINRTAGVGTGVQIRGTDANRVEINGVSSVGSGSGRTGISFDDLPAALIASLEVTKVPEAKTVEGSVGGTVNLRTLRGNSLKDRLVSFRVQAENSDLAESTTPRVSATFGDNWDIDSGKLGVVLTGSYAQQDVASFDPRYDRDRELLSSSSSPSAEEFSFFRTQFMNQVLTRYEYETTNFTGSLEFEPSDELKFYADVTLNNQERIQKSATAQFSGVGSNNAVDNTTNTEFETIDLGTIDGPNGPLILGEVQATLKGYMTADNGHDPNVRVVGSTGSRITDSHVFAFGGEWTGDKFELSAEISNSGSESDFPTLNTTLDFINPRSAAPVFGSSVDNATPVEWDASGGSLQFGIKQGLPGSPSTSDMLDPANYALRQVANNANAQDNDETAFRVDGSYDISDTNPLFIEIEAGLRWNESNSERTNTGITKNFTHSTNNYYRPRADLFSDIVTAGPDNFGSADGRDMFVKDYLIINGDLSFDNPSMVLGVLNDALATNNAIQIAAGNMTPEQAAEHYALNQAVIDDTAYFKITEETTAFYLQGNFETELGDVLITGNLGLRYIDTEITSVGNSITTSAEGEEIVSQTDTTASYDFTLPRFNIAAELTDKLIVRAGMADDIRRPNFDNLSTSIRYGGNAGAAVKIGNPALKPETVTSYDLSAEYYLTDSSILSVGLFHKVRGDIHDTVRENPLEITSPTTGQIERDITAPCEDGGIFNPVVTDRNVWSSSEEGVGICVPLESIFNVPNEETQSGLELAVQHDLSAYEDQLGWASGFGIIANYTYQKAGSKLDSYNNGNGDANALNDILGRTDSDQSTPTLDDDVVMERIVLRNLSRDSYNFTLFYDKNDISVRARYTWRSDFKTNDKISFDLPRIVGDRGQLNVSASYDINDKYTVGIEGVNLTREDRNQWCVNEGALLCSQGLTDRRVTFGITGKL